MRMNIRRVGKVHHPVYDLWIQEDTMLFWNTGQVQRLGIYDVGCDDIRTIIVLVIIDTSIGMTQVAFFGRRTIE
jgi:hypothetical protein